MIACASDEIMMGKHSSLEPIDPQFIISSGQGANAFPAQANLDQFEIAKEDCKDPQLLGVWAPILPQCRNGGRRIMRVYRDHECPADDALRDSLGSVRPRRAALQPASSRRRRAIARRTSSNDPRSPCTAVKSSNAESSRDAASWL